MVDIVSKKTRSRMMSGIRGKNTKPELVIRSGLHRLRFRYRLHYGDLPGKPDIVFPKYQAIILVNGCFWHGHGCNLFKWPTTRPDFWRNKIRTNQVRDQRNLNTYAAEGWRTLVIWECALKGAERRDPEKIVELVARWLKSGTESAEIEGKAP